MIAVLHCCIANAELFCRGLSLGTGLTATSSLEIPVDRRLRDMQLGSSLAYRALRCKDPLGFQEFDDLQFFC